jgi:hypothetical protein
MKIYLPNPVRGDFPIGHHLIAKSGYHEAVGNPLGAISVRVEGGLLGIKPDEFQHICARCECRIDADGCGCDPEDA